MRSSLQPPHLSSLKRFQFPNPTNNYFSSVEKPSLNISTVARLQQQQQQQQHIKCQLVNYGKRTLPWKLEDGLLLIETPQRLRCCRWGVASPPPLWARHQVEECEVLARFKFIVCKEISKGFSPKLSPIHVFFLHDSILVSTIVHVTAGDSWSELWSDFATRNGSAIDHLFMLICIIMV